MSLKNTTEICSPISFKHWHLHYPLKSPKRLFLFKFSKENLYTLLYYIHATCHINIIFLAIIILIISGEQYQTWSPLQNLLHPSIPTSISHQIFSSLTSSHKTLKLCSSHDVRHQISHPLKMRETMSILYISTCNIRNWIEASIAWNFPALLFKFMVLLKFHHNLTYLKPDSLKSDSDTSQALWQKIQISHDINIRSFKNPFSKFQLMHEYRLLEKPENLNIC